MSILNLFTGKVKVEVLEDGRAQVITAPGMRGGMKSFRSLAEAEEYVLQRRGQKAASKVVKVLYL